jgi:hypothetical protein
MKKYHSDFLNNHNESLNEIEELNKRLNLNQNTINSSELINPVTGLPRIRLSNLRGRLNLPDNNEIEFQFEGMEENLVVNDENVGNNDQNVDEN